MDRPRVAILAPLKQWGGLERSFAVLSEEFLNAGFVPEIVRIRGGEMPYPASLPAEVRSIELATRSKLDGIPRVAAYLRRTPPDALITARDHSAQVAVLARRLARVRVPLFISCTNMPSAVIRRPVQRFLARRLYPRADGIIAVSRGVADDVSRYLGVPADRVHLIYNPVITRDFERRRRAPLDSPWLDEAHETPVIVAAGRLSPPKDFVTIIDAFARLRQWQPARLLLLGEGPDRAELEQRVADCGLSEVVAMPGQVDDPIPYMHQASLFVFSSRYEGLGNVVVEALASGTRIVATDCPSGPREILDDGRYGRLVRPGDDESLAEAMAAALQEDRPTEEEVAAGSRRFRAAAVAEQYLQLLGLVHGPTLTTE